ncbi:UNVERIFIED_ORG: tetratricopeptide (TPR) repeat protein [Xanthobacter viscosus]|uniref:Uncharacterized protein n=1 Tax=Xanthobacter autotrophicus TaxID=280 RepID=A0A6C1K9D4_XANAU|nr:hypothetical protein [Xanthobacter autotrophicus]TLX40878.1 hypothetical protein FBQ73_20710 [Xanthobacter autotrophicus]
MRKEGTLVEQTTEAGSPDAVETVDAAAPADALPPGGDEAVLVRAALDRVLAAPDFTSSPRLAAFLRFVVEATLDGRADEIKGYTIAVEALGRPPSFDPQSDPIVRVEATRLRRALERYYATGGAEDPLVIDIPKGGYVPLFHPRTEAPVEPVPSGPEPQAAPTMPDAPPPKPLWRRAGALMAAAAVVVIVAGLALFAPRIPAFKSDRGAAMADRIRLPVVEVRPFEASGPGAPTETELRAIEERMRDAFARFDFVEVKAAGATAHEAGVPEACSGPQSRSVFALAGLAEGRADGTFSLVTRITDRCDGSIIWSATLDGLAQGTGLADSERRVVHDVAVAIIESYGVIPVRARAQALAKAPDSGFGCIAAAIAYIRGDPQGQRGNGTACLAELTKRERDFALGYAVRATVQLYATLHDDTPNPTTEEMGEFLDEAELASELAPASAYAARTLAVVQLYAGEPDDAVATAEKALKLNPLDFDVAATVATVFIGSGRVEEGEALLLRARREGAVRTNLQDAFLAMAAFMRNDVLAAQALVPQLTLHSAIENKLALALCLHTLGRTNDSREAVGALLHRMPDGAEGVRRLVHRLLPAPALADKALSALETAGLSREAVAGKPPRG